jgi:hypothetical protein
MFGCPCFFVNGNMVAGAHFSGIFVRLSLEDRAELLSLPGAAPFEPLPGRVMREYVVVAQSVAADAASLASWLARARLFALSLPTKEPRAGRGRRA